MNTLLVFLITRRTPKELQLYSRILLQTCVVDLLFVITSLPVMPVVIVVGERRYMLQAGFSQRLFPSEANFWLVVATVVLFMVASGSLAVQFVYRYLVQVLLLFNEMFWLVLLD